MAVKNLSDGWFVDRASGRGKPVYSSGTTVVPTNGIVVRGLAGGSATGTFGVGAPIAPTKNLSDAWMSDRSRGKGKPVYSSGTTIVPVNGMTVAATAGTDTSSSVGGKWYFEFTINSVATNVGQVAGAQIGFINETQRITAGSNGLTFLYGASVNNSIVAGGLGVWQGRNTNGAIVVYDNNPEAWIAGTGITNPAVPPLYWNVGDIFGVAIDTIGNRFWTRNYTQSFGTPFDQHWEGGGNPSAGSNGWNISAVPGILYIVFGAPGRIGADAITLNAGASAFYGLNGTGALPTGYTAWDTTGYTTWNGASAASTKFTGAFIDPAGVINTSLASIGITLSNNRLKASIATTTDPLSGSSFGSTWQSSATYQIGAVVMDSQSPNFGNAFYYAPTVLGPSLNQPVSNNSWESVIITVVSNTHKARV